MDHNRHRLDCIMLDWYLSKPEHVMKYAKLYLDQDFHVLQVHSSVVQILWPAAGVQVRPLRFIGF